MKPMDFEKIYNNNLVIYINMNEVGCRLGKYNGNKISYIHTPKVYSGERLGYMVIIVCEKIVFIISYLDGSPYIIDSIDEVYDFVKDKLSIKFNHFTTDEGGQVGVFDIDGVHINSKKMLAIHDSYMRGYLDERIAAYEAMSAPDTSDDEKQPKKNNVTIHVTYLSIIAIIVLTLFLAS